MTFFVARVLIAALFLVFGFTYIRSFSLVAADFTRMGMPLPQVATGLAIAIQIGAGMLLAIGWKARGAAWVLAAYVLVATLVAHRFWEFDPAYAANQMAHFFKNLALIGALLIIATTRSGNLSVDPR
jgi:putative oxidoreductase